MRNLNEGGKALVKKANAMVAAGFKEEGIVQLLPPRGGAHFRNKKDPADYFNANGEMIDPEPVDDVPVGPTEKELAEAAARAKAKAAKEAELAEMKDAQAAKRSAAKVAKAEAEAEAAAKEDGSDADDKAAGKSSRRSD